MLAAAQPLPATKGGSPGRAGVQNPSSDRLARLIRKVGQRTKPNADVRKSPPRKPVVAVDQPGSESQQGSGAAQKETVKVRFVLMEGVTVRAGDPVVARAGIPLVLVSGGRQIGTFENGRVAAGLRAGFTYWGVVESVNLARRRGVAQLQVS